MNLKSLTIFLLCSWFAACSSKREIVSECRIAAEVERQVQGTGRSLPRAEGAFEVIPDQFAAEYVMNFKFGDQILPLVIDSGSSNLIVKGNQQICSNCTGDDLYTPSDSATNLERSFAIHYGSGAGSAVQHEESIALECDPEPIRAIVGVLTQNTALPAGIWGLAYQNLAEPNDNPTEPFLDAMVKQRAGRMRNAFSVALCGSKPGSTVIIGDVDHRVSEDSIQYADVIEEKYYTIDAKSFNVVGWANNNGTWQRQDGAVTKIHDFRGFDAQNLSGVRTIVDTGTTMNIFPPEIVDAAIAIARTVNSQSNIGLPDDFFTAGPRDANYSRPITADQIAQFPVFQVIIAGLNGDITLTMEPNTYFKYLDRPGERTFSFRRTTGTNILGQVLLENHYVEFIREKTDDCPDGSCLGFAANAGLCGE